MADAPLFYKTVVPLNRERHRDLKLAVPETPFAFAAAAQMIPALAEEFGAAAHHLPIVFLPAGARPTPVFLTSLRPDHNSLVASDGAWTGGYLPAYLRRWPLIVGEVEGAEPLLCIDEASARLSREAGRPLFDAEGRDTPLLTELARFTTDYLAAAKRTEALSAKLVELDLLRPITIENKSEGQRGSVTHGLLVVDEQKLGALSDDAFLDLRRQGALGPLYAHLISLAAIDKLAKSDTPA